MAFLSAYSETNINGYTGQEMADMFINAGPIPSNIVFNKNFDKLITTQPTEDDFGFIGFKLSVDKKGKDQGKASLANHFIGYGAKGTSTYQYEQDAKKAGILTNYEGILDEFTIAFVSVNGNNKATEKAIFETIENAREVLENGGTVIMDSTADANRSWNKSGEALVQEGLGVPTGQTSKGYNYWGKNPEVTTQPTETRIAQPTETEDTPFELKETDRTNVFQYQDQLGDKDFYEKLVDANQTVVFVRNNVNETYSNQKKNFGGQQELDKFAGNMTMNITTSLTKLGDNFQNLPKQAYAEVIRLWEEEIAHIQSINDGQTKFTPIAFPETGFGDPALMPQELFVYLSTRLFDAFGYINPGSAMYNEMQKRTEIAEGLTDQEILDQLGLEEDPFKCK